MNKNRNNKKYDYVQTVDYLNLQIDLDNHLTKWKIKFTIVLNSRANQSTVWSTSIRRLRNIREPVDR